MEGCFSLRTYRMARAVVCIIMGLWDQVLYYLTRRHLRSIMPITKKINDDEIYLRRMLKSWENLSPPLLTPSLHYHPGILVLQMRSTLRGRQEDLDSWGVWDLVSRVDHQGVYPLSRCQGKFSAISCWGGFPERPLRSGSSGCGSGKLSVWWCWTKNVRCNVVALCWRQRSRIKFNFLKFILVHIVKFVNVSMLNF